MFIRRFYNDYLMPGRWQEYRAFLTAAQAKEYTFVRHQDALRVLTLDEPSRRLFFLRHDIDSDLPIARAMFTIEQEMGIFSTYYFRRCTADPVLMRDILSYGSEVGYHYEELSDYIKTSKICCQEDLIQAIDRIRETFLQNLLALETAIGTKIKTVASHGDWANRALGMENTALMNEPLRKAAGIRLEAYDKELIDQVEFRAADRVSSDLWHPSSPIGAIAALKQVILVLVHPRQWQRAPLTRLHMDTQRLIEGLRYHLK